MTDQSFWCTNCNDPMECGSWAACLYPKPARSSMDGLTQLQCMIRGKLVTVQQRMWRSVIFPSDPPTRVYDIYVDGKLIAENLGEPFGMLSGLWLDGVNK